MTAKGDLVESVQEFLGAQKRALAAADDVASLEVWRTAVFGRSGRINQLRREIGALPAADRPAVGRLVQATAEELTALYEQRRETVHADELAARLVREARDITFPARHRTVGGYHPVTLALRSICRIFEEMGFAIFESPHVELDELNFQLLNIPADHPARDMQDTFYASDGVVLRTHTSAGQIRAMRSRAPEPCQVILPGMCYRKEDITPRSDVQFHQIEGLFVGPGVRFSDLKGVLRRYARLAYGEDQDIRLRGSYFPFTEPSVEVDVKCTLCQGSGCRVCKHSGWLELLGAGLVHPTVLANGGYDPDKVQGFAFGMGIERAILLQHGIEDIRLFYQNDARLLSQFH